MANILNIYVSDLPYKATILIPTDLYDRISIVKLPCHFLLALIKYKLNKHDIELCYDRNNY